MEKSNEKKNILIFGDSYSTFKGYIPEGNAVYYSEDWSDTTDVRKVEETWWKQLITSMNANLLLNDSWSGSTIGYTGYNNADCSKSSSFIYRFRQLLENGFFQKNKPDIVLVFGGTNDSWSGAPLGEMKYSGWTEEDLFFVLPAICHFVYVLKQNLPHSQIVFMINTGIKEEIRSAIRVAAEYYGVESISLTEIRKACGHPTVAGMQDIYKQTFAWLQR